MAKSSKKTKTYSPLMGLGLLFITAAVVFCVLATFGLIHQQQRPRPVHSVQSDYVLAAAYDVEQLTKDLTDVKNHENGRLDILRRDGTPENLWRLNLSLMTPQQLLFTAHAYLDNIDIICHRKLRMGNLDNGGWEICDDPEVRPRIPCIVYAFGSGSGSSFDDATAALYGCQVYIFDPAIKENYDRSERVHYYSMGLGAKRETTAQGHAMFTFSELRNKLGHQNSRVDIIKMDIQESEWTALPQMIAAGDMKNVSQFLVEFHFFQPSTGDHGQLLSRLKVLQDLERMGFRKFYVHKNPACGTKMPDYPATTAKCFEVHYRK